MPTARSFISLLEGLPAGMPVDEVVQSCGADDTLSYAIMIQQGTHVSLPRHEEMLRAMGVSDDIYDIQEASGQLNMGPKQWSQDMQGPSLSDDTMRIFTSVLSAYAVWADESAPNAPGIAREMASGGVSLDRAKKGYYRDEYGQSFSCIWATTLKPHNTNTLWVAADIPLDWLVENSDLGGPFYIDAARNEGAQVRIGASIPPEWIVGFNGIPAQYFRG